MDNIIMGIISLAFIVIMLFALAQRIIIMQLQMRLKKLQNNQHQAKKQ